MKAWASGAPRLAFDVLEGAILAGPTTRCHDSAPALPRPSPKPLPPATSRLLFPYMAFARSEASRSRFTLSQSGMPPPDASLFGSPEPYDLDFAGVDALPTLQARIAELVGAEPERVIVTVGASGAMHICALRLFRGARVASDVPSYEPFRALPELLGAEAHTVRRRFADGWQIDPDEARHVLSGCSAGGTPGHVFVTNTHNPTGARTDAERVRALADAAAAAGGALVSCEVYMEYLPPEARVEAWKLAPNGISIGSLTKAYGLGGLRIGWIVLGDAYASERALFEDLVFLAWVDPSTPALRVALRALGLLPELRARIAHFERTSKPHFQRFLEQTDGVEGLLPEHGIVGFPKLAGISDTRSFARRLAAEYEVDVVPGEFFGEPGHVRIGFGQDEEVVREGLERLARAIADLRR